MAGTVVRKEVLAALVADDGASQPPDLDGWATDDVEAVMGGVIKGFRRARLAVGYLLWKHRALNVDAVYGAYASNVAQECDVDVRTLQRWRVFAETKWNLPPPDRRTEAQRELADKRPKPVPKADPSAERSDIVSLPDAEEKPETVTPDAVIDPTPEPEPPPKPAPKSAQLSLFEEREGRLIVPARPPASREEVQEAKRIAKAYLDWAATASFDPPTQRVPKRENPYATKPNQRARRPGTAAPAPAKNEKCLHPITRRIGGDCAACGAKVGGK